MATSVLVAYATRYGSTLDAAEKIAAVLREFEFVVDVKPAREVNSIEGYQAVVVGAPIEIGRWHGDAHHFLSQNRDLLKQVPVAVFALGPLHRDESEMHEARAQLDKELGKYLWLNPVATQMFVGRFDPTKLHFPASLFMGKIPATDEMDWEAIRSWAQGLSPLFAHTGHSARAVMSAI